MYFTTTSLSELGLRVQLGHAPGHVCANPKPAPLGFTVIHTNGSHSVNVDYCECDQSTQAGSHRIQLLRRRWYPATHVEPGSCASFAVLELFNMLNLQGKIAAYDFYSAVLKLMDNVGLKKFKVSNIQTLVLHAF